MYQISRHQHVKQSHGENSESNEHNSMPLQLYVRRHRRQVAMVMVADGFAQRLQNIVKTIDLNKTQTYSQLQCRQEPECYILLRLH